MGIFSKLFGWIGKLVSKIVKCIKRIFSKFKFLMLFVFVLCIFCPVLIPMIGVYFGASAATIASLTAVSTAIAGLGLVGQCAIAGFGALLLFPKETTKVLGRAGKAVKSVASTVMDITGTAFDRITDRLSKTGIFQFAKYCLFGYAGIKIYQATTDG